MPRRSDRRRTIHLVSRCLGSHVIDSLESRLTLSAAPNPLDAFVGYDPATGQEKLETLPAINLSRAAADAVSGASSPGADGSGHHFAFPAGDGRTTGGDIIGTDDRILVGPNPASPFQRVVKLYVTFPDGSSGIGTGTMISPYHVLTAGHVVYDKSRGGWTNGIRSEAGKDRDNRPYGAAGYSYVRTYSAWVSSSDWNYDMALITLDRRVGNFTGWFGYQWRGNTADFNNMTLTSAGYPGDLNGGERMYRHTNFTSSFATDDRVYYTLDSGGGQSGSGVWNSDGYIQAVHTNAEGASSYSSGTRMTQGKFTATQDWINEDNASRAPTDRPDLTPYDSFFNENVSTLSHNLTFTGRTFDVTARVANMGTAASGAFNVSFYASLDQNITTSDVFMGSTSVSSIAALSSASTSLSFRVPTSMASGIYTIGWIIDTANSVAEYREGSDNVGFVRNQTIAVNRIAPDAYEPNDAMATGYPLSNSDYTSINNLTLHDYGDTDYYRVVAAGNGTMKVDLDFLHAAGDIDLRIYNAAGALVASSNSSDDDESATFAVTAGQAYYIDVYGYNQTSHFNYAMIIDGPAAPPADTTPPRVLSRSFQASPAHTLDLQLSEDVAGSSSVSDYEVRDIATNALMPVSSYSYYSSNLVRLSFNPRLADGKYRLRIVGTSLRDATGNFLDGDGNGSAGGDFVFDFNVMSGDPTGDGAVGFDDMLIVAKNYNQNGRTFAQGDLNYDTRVNFDDLLILAKQYGQTSLSAIVQPPATLASSNQPSRTRRTASDLLA